MTEYIWKVEVNQSSFQRVKFTILTPSGVVLPLL